MEYVGKETVGYSKMVDTSINYDVNNNNISDILLLRPTFVLKLLTAIIEKIYLKYVLGF